jgi:TonB family protein
MAEEKDDIEKYIKGELSPAQMHELEKRALSDAFLRDALEGAEQIGAPNFSKDIRGLTQKIKGNKKTIWFSPLRIAAGIVLVGTVSLFVFIQNQNTQEKALAMKESEPAKDQAKAATDSVSVEEKKNEKLLSLNQPESKTKSEKEFKPGTSEVASSKPAFEEQPQNTGEEKTDPSEETLAKELTVEEPVKAEAKQERDIQKLSAELEDTKRLADASARGADRKKALAPTGAGAVSSDLSLANAIQGQVKSEDGQPLPGVNVLVKGTQTGTVTDLNGNYTLPAQQPDASLVFSYLGYQSNEVIPAGKELVNVVLTEDPTQLSEVVVVSQRPADKADDLNGPVVRLAEPFGGRKAYDKYLEKNLRYPVQALENKIKGRVTIEFTVATDGSLGDFSVIRGLGYGCDDEVIRLVKEGPKWFPTTQDDIPVESNVRVRMKFDPAKAGQ